MGSVGTSTTCTSPRTSRTVATWVIASSTCGLQPPGSASRRLSMVSQRRVVYQDSTATRFARSQRPSGRAATRISGGFAAGPSSWRSLLPIRSGSRCSWTRKGTRSLSFATTGMQWQRVTRRHQGARCGSGTRRRARLGSHSRMAHRRVGWRQVSLPSSSTRTPVIPAAAVARGVVVAAAKGNRASAAAPGVFQTLLLAWAPTEGVCP
mmetsp:Transcript_115362/g.326012  ORF Transcript_115362/g.326012 Transcript_115362/m.326012 type:complete len:208 (-) Transcript_115362:447-1070(-)